MQDFSVPRLLALRERRTACDLTDAELLELHRLEYAASPNAYGHVVAALSTFPPYLDARPHLIGPFVMALWPAWAAAFRGQRTRAEFEDFLDSKAHVDDDLGAALAHHRPAFDQALSNLTYSV